MQPTTNEKSSRYRRKQFQSCDQCRKWHRACDAVSLGVTILGRDQTTAPGESSAVACSSCQRSKKTCTFEWLENYLKSEQNTSISVDNTSSNPPLQENVVSSSDMSGIEQAWMAAGYHEHTIPYGSSVPPATVSDQPFDTYQVDNRISSYGSQGFTPSEYASGSTLYNHQIPILPPTGSLEQIPNRFNPQISSPQLPIESLDRMSNNDGTVLNSFSSQPLAYDEEVQQTQRQGQTFEVTQVNQSKQPPYETSREQSVLADKSRNQKKRKRAVNLVENHVAQVSTKKSITKSMFQIYTEMFEGTLSVWIKVSGCPYKVVPHMEMPNSNWLTRSISDGGLCARMIQLDRKCQILRPKPLTSYEITLASNALKLTIMAYASQWGIEAESHKAEARSSNSFAHLMNRSLWNEANRALQLCSHLDSFRVVLAILLFNLIAEPSVDEMFRITDSIEDDESLVDSQDDEFGTVQNHTPEVQNMAYSPEITTAAFSHLRKAITLLFEWKRRFKKSKLITIDGNNVQLNATSPSKSAFKDEEVQDVLLVIWMGVAFDSFSSFLHNKPFIFSDIDVIRLDSGDFSESKLPPVDSTVNLGISHLPPPLLPVWTPENNSFLPPSPQTIQLALFDSSAVSYVLWRSGAKLRAVLRQRAPPEEVARVLSAVLDVYYHWQNNYGRVLKWCVPNYSKLSFKIQTSFVQISTSSSYLCLLIADCIEYYDSLLDVEDPEKIIRDSKFLVPEIRKETSFILSDMVRVAGNYSSTSNPGHEHHEFIINHTALACDPWPEVMSQALSRCCEILLEWIARFQDPNENEHFASWLRANVEPRDLLQRARDCLEGIKKSSCKTSSRPISTKLWRRVDKIAYELKI